MDERPEVDGEVEGQVGAWADAAWASAQAAGTAVSSDEVMAAPAPTSAGPGAGRGGSRWLRPVLAAAAVVAVLVGGAVVLGSTDDDAEPLQSGPTTTVGSVDGEEVDFELLHLGTATPAPGATDEEWDPEQPVLWSASTQEQLERLWTGVRHLDPTRSSTPPVPEIDFDEQVVVSITIPDDNCPPELDGFDRRAVEGQPDQLVPQFVETATACEQPLIPKQYVVALDWASTGDRFSVFVDGGNLSGEPDGPSADARSAEIRLDRARPAPVPVDLELEATTVEAGSTLSGQVVVSNNTGVSIPITYCGAELALGLENDEVDQQLGFNACLEQGELAPGVTAFDVEVSASYGSCVAVGPDNPQPDGMAACLPGGAIPPLPPGEYRTRLYPPGGLAAVGLDVDELAVTVTAP